MAIYISGEWWRVNETSLIGEDADDKYRRHIHLLYKYWDDEKQQNKDLKTTMKFANDIPLCCLAIAASSSIDVFGSLQ